MGRRASLSRPPHFFERTVMLKITEDDLTTARRCCEHLHNLLFDSIEEANCIHPNEFESVLQMTGNIAACFDMGVARTHPKWIDRNQGVGVTSGEVRARILDAKRDAKDEAAVDRSREVTS